MSQVAEFSFVLQKRDFAVLRSVRTHMTVNKLTEFSADDVRGLGLDCFKNNTLHGMGGWFACMQHGGYIEPVGRVRSLRPKRRLAFIKTYRLTDKDLETGGK